MDRISSALIDEHWPLLPLSSYPSWARVVGSPARRAAPKAKVFIIVNRRVEKQRNGWMRDATLPIAEGRPTYVAIEVMPALIHWHPLIPSQPGLARLGLVRRGRDKGKQIHFFVLSMKSSQKKKHPPPHSPEPQSENEK
jgi:hypothetical protein